MKWLLLLGSLLFSNTWTGTPKPNWQFDAQLKSYFETRVREISAENDLTKLHSESDIKAAQEIARAQLWDMLGMNPRPGKTELNVRITKIIEHDLFTIENIVFEALPGLYVTGNLYRPEAVKDRLPAILYVCGHASVIKDGYNYGAKAHYQHHPAWYAQNGYICLVIDTVQLGEIEGIHHGLYRYNRWWWLNRGYTPAGIEAWNAIRAIDYLVSRPEVDSTKIGMTGRSGGGVTSWWVGALDERIKVVAPISGITDLENHVVDGCVEGHCDCMYYVNSYQWDFPKLGLLIAPRPLLIGNADQDGIFPLDGVYRTYQQIKSVYDQLGGSELIALNIVGGGHHDIQDIQIPTFRWFNQFLKDKDELIELAAKKYLTPEDLRVLDEIPKDQQNTTIDQHFVAQAPPLSEVLSESSFTSTAQEWRNNLEKYVFNAWPDNPEYHLGKIKEFEMEKFKLSLFQLQTQENIFLPLLVLQNKSGKNTGQEIHILDDEEWMHLEPFLTNTFGADELWSHTPDDKMESAYVEKIEEQGLIIFLPLRGAGIASYSGNGNEMIHIRRRYFLLGETLESAQTFDLYQGLSALQGMYPHTNKIVASGATASMLAYATLQKSGYDLHLQDPSSSQEEGPFYLNISRYMDGSASILMASTSNVIHIQTQGSEELNDLRTYVSTRPEFQLHFSR